MPKKKPTPRRVEWTEFEVVAVIGAEKGKSYDWEQLPEGVQIVFRNSRYEVHFAAAKQERGHLHLSIKNLRREPVRDWRDLQRIKNELAGEEREAVELFPAESRLTDSANQYHLWVLPEGERFPFGFKDRFVLSPEEVAALHAVIPMAKQRRASA